MAHYHFTVKSGERGSGADHAQYIQRSGRFKVERGYGEIGESEVGNLPAWARGKAATFFARADDYERANGTAYREYELALPVELSDFERGQLVREFVKAEVGERRAYVWAIHEPKGHNPHVHVMFSDRQADGIERGAEQYFKRANPKNPERGGAPKFRQGESQAEVSAALVATRERWATMTNRALERAGVEARVDHRSLEAQGILQEAGEHRGPAVSGIEARGKDTGKVAEVTLRREAEQVGREQALRIVRQAVVAEIREVTREEVAAEKSAARERRDLLPETHGVVRQELVAQVEADRREQVGRTAAQAERRIERRRGLPGRVGEKLLAQARALRDRVVELGGRVKEWVAERVAEPLQQILEHTREALGASGQGEKDPRSAARPTMQELQAEGRRAWLAEREREVGAPPPLSLEELRRQGREEWLSLRAELARETSPPPPAATPSPKVERSPDQLASAISLEVALEQIKAEGRAALEAVRQELQAERQREQQRQAALDQERKQSRSRGRGRGLGRGPQQDGPDMER